MEAIKYYSTNKKAEKVSFGEALLQGQAPDKGLYMPDKLPQINAEEIVSWKEKPYWEIAFEVTRRLLGKEVPDEKLREICRKAYNFAIPLEELYDRKFVMRLDSGPTASFKDFAARMMARLVQFFLKSKGRNLTISTATSGDTGSAVANAFHNLKNIEAIVLFPEKEVSERQRKQMTTVGENITAIALKGKFDDCQAIVKRAFADAELRLLNLSSANSVNIGRLLPQTVYYFYAHAKLAQSPQEKIVFSVPSGNFGNACAGIIAMKMGLPVERFVIATNENDEFPRFMQTGVYEKIVPSRNCISNSMNVGHPSNLVRIIDIYGGWMDETSTIREMPDIDAMRKEIFSISVSDKETIEAIKQAYQEFKVVLEPHGAVGWKGLQEFLKKEPAALCVSLETAHPSKFPETVEQALGFEPEPANCIKELEKKQELFEIMENDYSAFKQLLKKMA